MAIDETGKPKPDELETDWEEVPDEDLWEDGEITFRQVAMKIYEKVCMDGNWKLLRRKHEQS